MNFVLDKILFLPYSGNQCLRFNFTYSILHVLFLGLMALFLQSFANCAILHPFFFSDFTPHFFTPFLILHPIFGFNCTLAPIFLLIVRFRTLSSFFLAILHPIFCPLSPLLMMILNKTQLAKDGCKIAQKKKKGCKIAQLAKDKGKSAIKPIFIYYFWGLVYRFL